MREIWCIVNDIRRILHSFQQKRTRIRKMRDILACVVVVILCCLIEMENHQYSLAECTESTLSVKFPYSNGLINIFQQQ